MQEMHKVRSAFIIVLTLSFLCFQGYIAFIRPFGPLLQNPIHLMFALMITFLYTPVCRKTQNVQNSGVKKWLFLIDAVIITILSLIGLYFIIDAERLMYRLVYLDPLETRDYLVMIAMMLALLEAVRRTLGLTMLIFILFFIIYAWFGKYFPGIFFHRGTNLQQFTDLMVMTADGIFGAPLNASASFMYYFVIFGVFFAAGGGGQVLVDLGMKVSSSSQTGGPAKAAVISSGLFGMVNGSAVANVMTTGVMTIPLMKKVGYQSHQAGAVEAVASTGGQLMPPIMGIGAFIMSEMTGIPYLTIAMSALIPALAYYLAIFLVVDFLARKRSISGATNLLIESQSILKRLYLLLPVVVLLGVIVMGRSLRSAAITALFVLLVINILRWKKGLRPKELFKCLLEGTRSVGEVAIPTSSCGIIIGIVIMSGLTTRLSQAIGVIGSSNLAAALIISAMGCLVLGMALPTVAAYLSAYILFVPVLRSLGLPVLAANLFIFYFGVIAQITPPVCLASFAASGIAGSNSWKTGWTAFQYALTGFLVPFVFVEKPGIILSGTVVDTIVSTSILFFGIFFLAASLTGYLFGAVNSKLYRFILFVIAMSIVIPEDISTYVGVGIGIVLIIIAFIRRRHMKTASV
jgi:TRAP transporter 4TM/12TM fusion protein